MADQANQVIIPYPESLRQVLAWVGQRLNSYPLFERLSTVVKPWILTRTDKVNGNKPPRAVFTKISNLWPCGSKDEPFTLRFSFFRPADNIIQRNRESKVQIVIKQIEEQVPGVKFKRVDRDSDAEIRIAFNHEHPYGKTWSRVGREAERVDSDEPTMNLSDVRHESGEIQEGSKEYGDVMHEFFHTLGMLHEHQHPDRKFTISTTAVRKDMEDEGWSEEDINDNIVQKLNPSTIGAYSPMDMASCMSYNIPRKWTKDGSEVEKNDKPSDLDFAWLNLVYPPPDPKKFEQALSESMDSRINKEHKNLILKLYLDGEWDRVRSKITSVSNPKSTSSKKGVVGKMRTKLKLGQAVE